jgi:type II secretory pathway component HofQ
MRFGANACVLLVICCLIAAAVPATARAAPPAQEHVGRLVSLDLRDVPLVDILRFFHQQFGVNFVVDADVPAVRVTVSLREVPWDVALEAILRANGLGATAEGPSTWTVSAQPGLRAIGPSAQAGRRIVLTYQRTPLREVVRDLRARTGANIVIDESVRSGLTVTAELGEVDWEQGLGWILWSLGLGAVRRDGALVIVRQQ